MFGNDNIYKEGIMLDWIVNNMVLVWIIVAVIFAILEGIIGSFAA